MYKRVLLVFPDYKGGHFGALRPPAGLGYIAQALQDHTIEYDVLDMSAGYTLYDLQDKIKHFSPDLLGISLMSYMYKRSYQIIDFAKKISPNLRIVAGGPHISTFREIALEECLSIDYGVILEGEETMVELCQGKRPKDIQGLIWRKDGQLTVNPVRPFNSSLDSLRFPHYHKFPLQHYVTEEIGIVSSRGCPYACIYCPVNAAIGTQWRKRSPQSIIEELIYWYNKGYKQFSILDDNFTLDKPRAIEVCRLIQQQDFQGIELNCNNGLRADNVDRYVLEAMRKAGFKYLAFGVEAGNNKVLKLVNKGETIEQIEQAIRLALSLGYKVTLFFLVGSPGETIDDLKDSVKLALKYPVFDARFYNLIPFPNSPLYEQLKRDNLLIKDARDYLNDASQWDNSPVFVTPEMDRQQRIRALRFVRKIRQVIRYNAMCESLSVKLGPFSKAIAWIYVQDWVQELLMKNSLLRRNLKKAYEHITGKSAVQG